MVVSSSDSLRDACGNRIYQYIAAITANLGIISSEMHYGWSSPFIPVLRSGKYSFHISSDEGSWLTVMPLVGAFFGAFFTATVVDKIGRKRLIVFSSLPFIASWLMIAFAKSSTLMFIGRFLAGAADGLSFTAVPMYLGEIADPKIRGLLASICPVSIVFGILFINVIGAYLPLDTCALIGTFFPLLLLITFTFMPESPYFYLMKGRTIDARRSLRVFRGMDNVNEELTRISMAVKEQNESKGSFLDMFTVKSNRKGMIVTLGLRGIQQLSGTTAIIFYCKTIFEESEGFISSNTSTIIYFSLQLVLSSVASFIVDFSGRRPLLIISITGTAIALLANGIFLYLKNCTEVDTTNFNFVPLIALLLYVIVFSMGLQTIPLLMIGEMYPTNIKAFALCSMDMYYSVIVAIISKFFHWSNDQYGMHVPFFTFFCCCVLGLVFIIIVVPETKGKTLEDIQADLRGHEKIVRYVEEAAYY
ncbi:hypothetical protein JTB14_026189 [Gonioctena quinquepunctata]|nr:hypothetical protein JTB14_026189 [Gonioctena quinquepunctata]